MTLLKPSEYEFEMGRKIPITSRFKDKAKRATGNLPFVIFSTSILRFGASKGTLSEHISYATHLCKVKARLLRRQIPKRTLKPKRQMTTSKALTDRFPVISNKVFQSLFSQMHPCSQVPKVGGSGL